LVEGPERERVLGFFLDRFGMDSSVFAGYDLRNAGSCVWLVSRDPQLSALCRLKIRSVGLLPLRQVGRYLKPPSASLKLLGAHATRHVIRLGPDELEELLDSGELRREFAASPGYALIVVEGFPVGCALYPPPRLLSRLPPVFRSKRSGG